MGYDPIAELEQLTFEMRTTNITRGLKIGVYERWCNKMDEIARAMRHAQNTKQEANAGNASAQAVANVAGKVKK